MRAETTSGFDELIAARAFYDLDIELAHVVLRRYGRLADEADRDLLAAGIAFASRAVARGHVCVDLRRLVTEPLLDVADRVIDGVRWPEVETWLAALRAAPFADVWDDVSEARPAPPTPRPLGMVGSRVYLARYLDYEARTAEALVRLARLPGTPEPVAGGGLAGGASADGAAAAGAAGAGAAADGGVPSSERPSGAALQTLFGGGACPLAADGTIVAAADRQQLAAAVALRRRLTVVSGGPGTGKTTTVVKILALALLQDPQRSRVLMLAPTGKAAHRLTESIQRSSVLPDLDAAVRATVCQPAMTVHRALGFRPATPTRFARHRGHPLDADLIVVDEASMIDIALFAKLLDAVPPSARLILLGDRNQLASVEAGAIYGDLCRVGRDRYSMAFANEIRGLFGEAAPEDPGDRSGPEDSLEGPSAVADCIVQLTKSYRYAESGGIASLARAIQDGDAEDALALLDAGGPDLEWAGGGAEPWPAARIERDLVTRIEQGERLPTIGEAAAGDGAATPAERLGVLDEFRVLAAHRRGRFGVEHLNRLVEETRRGHVRVDTPYPGRPVMVTRNEYRLGLFNGDLGVLAPSAAGAERLAAWFPAVDDTGPRRFALSGLPDHEIVHAMTIHKSQGSEFDTVLVVLPEVSSPILTRELLYTAVTRAKHRVVLYGSAVILRAAIRRRIERASGLAERLMGG